MRTFNALIAGALCGPFLIKNLVEGEDVAIGLITRAAVFEESMWYQIVSLLCTHFMYKCVTLSTRSPPLYQQLLNAWHPHMAVIKIFVSNLQTTLSQRQPALG